MTTQLIIPTVYNVEPSLGYAIYQIDYTKAEINDTIDVASYTPIKTILYVIASDKTAGVLDETTWSGTIITLLNAVIDEGSLLVVGKC